MLIQIQILRVFLETTIKLQWQHYSPSISWGSTQVFLFAFPPILSIHDNIVPSTTHYLIVSPFVPKYTIHNSYLKTNTTVTVKNYSAASVAYPIPEGVPAYVESVTINGMAAKSRCYVDFYDTFRVGGEIEIVVTHDKKYDCGGPVPESLSTGGFASAR